jgi:hypothetical protein
MSISALCIIAKEWEQPQALSSSVTYSHTNTVETSHTHGYHIWVRMCCCRTRSRIYGYRQDAAQCAQLGTGRSLLLIKGRSRAVLTYLVGSSLQCLFCLLCFVFQVLLCPPPRRPVPVWGLQRECSPSSHLWPVHSWPGSFHCC